MRVFDSIPEAHSEILRDIYKAPFVDVGSIQGRGTVATARELMGYTYTIRDSFVPTHVQIAEWGTEWDYWGEDDEAQVVTWLVAEERARLGFSGYQEATEKKHPLLSGLLEGEEPSYTYQDRLDGMMQVMLDMFKTNPTSRRGYWPIFDRQDSYRALRNTRVPCSLGYQFMIRNIGEERYLHMTYVQRSCDFDRFWLSDVWFARRIQECLVDQSHDLHLGYFTHMVISLHKFFAGTEEIY